MNPEPRKTPESEQAATPSLFHRLRQWRWKRIIGLSALMLTAVVVLAGGSYYVWLTTPPPLPRTAKEAGELLMSQRYLRLPENRRMDYVQRAAELYDNASADEKKELRELRRDPANREALKLAMQDRINLEMRKYVTADEFDRRQMIDRVIAMQEMFASRMKNRPRPEQTPERQARREKRQNEFMQEIQKQIEQGNPQHQAYVGEFFKALMERRKAMGLDPLPFDPDRR